MATGHCCCRNHLRIRQASRASSKTSTTRLPRLPMPGTLGFCARPSQPLILPRGCSQALDAGRRGLAKVIHTESNVQCIVPPIPNAPNSGGASVHVLQTVVEPHDVADPEVWSMWTVPQAALVAKACEHLGCSWRLCVTQSTVHCHATEVW